MGMQVGCGVYLHTVRRRAYLYFWHYESHGGRRVQIKEYVGAARAARTREEALRRCEAYYRRATQELNRSLGEILAQLSERD
jgi:hypothetical protein